MQLRELHEYAERRGWEVVAEYTDSGISGAKSNRPALDRLMRDAAQRKFDAIAVYKLDRFGRSVLNLSHSLATLDAHGIRFVAITQGLDTDRANPTSRLLLNVLGAVAEFEREIIRERTVSGIRAAKAAGKHVGRPKRVFRRDEVIRLRDEEGLSWRAIGQRLGIPAMTAVDSYNNYGACTERVSVARGVSPKKTRNKAAAV